MRGGDGTTLTNSNIWNVDTSISGTMCLADPSLVRLWRPTKDGVATYSITAPSGGTVNVLFDEGDTDAPWDTQLLPLSEEVEYTIRGPGGVPESKVSFIVLETPPNEPEELAAVLIDKGCTSQLDLLASTLAMPQG